MNANESADLLAKNSLSNVGCHEKSAESVLFGGDIGLSLLAPNGWLTRGSADGCGTIGRNCVVGGEASKSAMIRAVRLIGGNCRSRYFGLLG